MAALVHGNLIETHFRKTQQRKGEDASSHHVIDFEFDQNTFLCKGTVHASQGDKSYKCQATVAGDRLVDPLCSCPVGKAGRCHHLAALMTWAKNNVSRTDLPCKWSQPKKVGKGNGGQPVDALFQRRKVNEALPGPLSKREMKDLLSTHHMCGGAAGHMKWLLENACGGAYVPRPKITSIINEFSPSPPALSIPSIAKATSLPEYREATDKLDFIKKFCNLTPAKIEAIAMATIGQASNPLWTESRLHRLTASIIGEALANLRSGRLNVNLMDKIAGTARSLKGIKAVDWGVEHEPTAIKQSESESGLTVHPSGFWLHESAILGGSPDGFINASRQHIIEVKCPWKLRNSSMRQAFTGCEDYVVQYDDGKWILNKNHPFYHQIQGQLYVLDASKCCLISFVRPNQKLAIIPVPRDLSWMSTVPPMLFRYYKEKHLPYAFRF